MTALAPRRHRRPTALLATVALVLLAGCGAELGDGATPGGGGGGGGGGSKELTIEQLQGLVPTAKDVPDDYRSAPNDDDDDDDATDEAIQEACPDAEVLQGLMDTNGYDEAVDARKKYETADARSLEFSFTLDPSALPEDKIDAYLTAINGCDVIQVDDPDQGELSMDLGAEPLEVGDYGLVLTATVSLEYQGEPLEIDLRSRYFVRNGVGLAISTTSGLNGQDYAKIAADDDVADQLATEVDAQVQELTE